MEYGSARWPAHRLAGHRRQLLPAHRRPGRARSRMSAPRAAALVAVGADPAPSPGTGSGGRAALPRLDHHHRPPLSPMNTDQLLRDDRRERQLFAGRLLVALLGMAALAGLLVWRYFDLQVVRHEDFVTRAERNRIHARAIPPPRGLIFDRHGVLLADNRPGFILSIIIERAGDLDQLLAELQGMIALGEADIQRFRQLAAQRRPYEAVPLR